MTEEKIMFLGKEYVEVDADAFHGAGYCGKLRMFNKLEIWDRYFIPKDKVPKVCSKCGQEIKND